MVPFDKKILWILFASIAIAACSSQGTHKNVMLPENKAQGAAANEIEIAVVENGEYRFEEKVLSCDDLTTALKKREISRLVVSGVAHSGKVNIGKVLCPANIAKQHSAKAYLYMEDGRLALIQIPE